MFLFMLTHPVTGCSLSAATKTESIQLFQTEKIEQRSSQTLVGGDLQALLAAV